MTITWNEYAAEHKQCYAKLVCTQVQATRHEPAKTIRFWDVFLPEPHGTVACSTIEQARALAKQYDCTILI